MSNPLLRSARRVAVIAVAVVGIGYAGLVLEIGTSRVEADDASCCTSSRDCSGVEYCKTDSTCPDPKSIHTRSCVANADSE